MDDIKEVDQDDGTQFIKVDLYDTSFTSTILRTAVDTTTGHLVDAIINKIEISADDQKYHKLVLVVTSVNDNSKKCSKHCIRTLRRHEIVLDVESQLRRRETLKYQLHTSSSRWFFKDIRSSPLELGEAFDLSGDESPEEGEEEISLNDLSSMSQTHRSGYLLKRSAKDPNVWLSRHCFLTDKLWCVNDRLRVPRASCIPLNSSTKLQNKCLTLNCPGAIILQSNQGNNFFLTTSAAEQQSWMNDLGIKATLMTDNNVIGMAEMIICDEERTRHERIQRGMTPFLNSDAVTESLNPCNIINGASNIDIDCKESHDMNFTGHSSGAFLDYIHPLLSSRFSARQTLLRPSIHELQKRDSSIFEVLTFVKSVYLFKELFRHDLGISAEAQWKAALLICGDCLVIPFSRVSIPTETETFTPDHGQTSPPIMEKIDYCDGNEISGNQNFGINETGALLPRTKSTYWDKVSIDVILLLHHAVHYHVRKCDIKTGVSSLKGGVVDNKVFPRTPSAGGEDSSMRILFGEGVSSSSLSLSPAVLSASGSSLWSWTSKALGFVENAVEDDNDEVVSPGPSLVKNVAIDWVGKRTKSASEVSSPVRAASRESSEINAGSPRNVGVYIVVSTTSTMPPDIVGHTETYYLKDRNCRPDSSLFDDLIEELRCAMGS